MFPSTLKVSKDLRRSIVQKFSSLNVYSPTSPCLPKRMNLKAKLFVNILPTRKNSAAFKKFSPSPLIFIFGLATNHLWINHTTSRRGLLNHLACSGDPQQVCTKYPTLSVWGGKKLTSVAFYPGYVTTCKSLMLLQIFILF